MIRSTVDSLATPGGLQAAHRDLLGFTSTLANACFILNFTILSINT
jgi:hypothetical protein